MRRARKHLDRLDLRILALLLRDGRLSKSRIAEEIGLTITPCSDRIRRLEKMGIIRGYHADLDFAAITDFSLFRLNLNLNHYSLDRARQFEKVVCRTPEILECEAVLGEYDYQLLYAAHDVDHYQQSIETLMDCIEDGFDYWTFPISKVVKSRSATSDLLLQEHLHQ